jgi:hypothetical protein
MTTRDTPEAAHRPRVRNADLAIWTTCLDCGKPACWVGTGWEPRPPDGEPANTGYWRHARKPKQ